MLTVHNPWILFDSSLYITGISQKSFHIMIFGLILLMVSDLLKYKHICVREIILKQDFWFRCLVVVLSIWFIMVFGIWGTGYNEAGFIYFQF